jgi:UDP-N-acetylglucosamine--N-acetylmuramyl-(pentapeptide) pyrophosphoryl-undecaprenol N-acetylglucosamine transferase
MKPRRIIISGGGTGGHLYPALAIGRKLREKDASLALTFVGGHREIEKKIMAEQGVDFIPMRIEGLKGRGLKSVRALLLLPFSFLKSLVLLARIRPALIIGVGGYSSGPVVLSAAWLGISTLILEQNVRPGFTNRMLARLVDKAVVAFDGSLPDFRGKGVRLGNPVREDFYAMPRRARGDTLTVLVFGGSQGSRCLNRAVTEALPLLREKRDRLAIFHQTGKDDREWVDKAYRESGFGDAVVAPYFSDMAAYFRRSDLIVSRAGATTCAELIASGKPSLLIPFAGASEIHQEPNAREMERAGGAEVVLEKDLTPEVLARKVLDLLARPEALDRMADGLAGLRTPGAADGIAELCFRLMEGKA